MNEYLKSDIIHLYSLLPTSARVIYDGKHRPPERLLRSFRRLSLVFRRNVRQKGAIVSVASGPEGAHRVAQSTFIDKPRRAARQRVSTATVTLLGNNVSYNGDMSYSIVAAVSRNGVAVAAHFAARARR